MANDVNNLSDEAKLLIFYTKSKAMLQEIVENGRKTFSIVDELDLPYHIFDRWRLLVEGTNELYTLISELLEKKAPKTLAHWEFEQLSAERKLLIFQYEYRTKFGAWNFHSQWLLNWLEERAELNLPVEFLNWCQFVNSTVVRIHNLLDSFSFIPPMDSQLEDKILQDMQAKWWAYEKAEFPILSQYESYSNALKETAQQAGLLSFEQIKIRDISPPSGYVIFFTTNRRVQTRIQSNSSLSNYGEYILTLQWRTKDQYQTWQGYASISSSLEAVVMVLHHWLIDNWDLNRICQKYPWMQKAVIDTGFQPTVLPKNLRKSSGFDAPLQSARAVYETDTGGRLILEAVPITNDIKQETARSKTSSVSVSGIPAQYFRENNEQEVHEDASEYGTLAWSDNGITYKIHHSGLNLSRYDIIQIAEGLRWTVL